MSGYFGFAPPSGTGFSTQQPPAAYQTTVTAPAAPAAVAAGFVQPAPATPYSAAATVAAPQYSYTAAAAPAAYPTLTAGFRAPVPPPPAAPPPQAYSGWSTNTQTYSYSSSNSQPSKTAPPPPPIPKSAYTGANYSNLTPVTTTQVSYPGYQAALYSAASTYFQQQQKSVNKTIVAGSIVGNNGNQQNTTGQFGGQKRFFQKKPFNRPRDQSVHYCDVCKISCAGPQTYKEHLEGQKHKKREELVKRQEAGASGPKPGQKQLRCELCDVTCTGADAYAAHIRGAKHIKTAKLHQRLGKPVPSADPLLIKPKTASISVRKPEEVVEKTSTAFAANSNPVKKVVATPKISFVGGSALKTISAKESGSSVVTPKSNNISITPCEEVTSSGFSNEERVDLMSLQDKDATPVGYEYIDEMKNDLGKVVQFHCKLCDCKFNDPNAKEMHLKGRRHRLQYKKKVDPTLEVDIKPSIKARRVQEETTRRNSELYWRRRDMEERSREMQMMEWANYNSRVNPPMRGPPVGGVRRVESVDDKHMMAKHASIYPTEEELHAVQTLVSGCEKALKLVSDKIATDEEEERKKKSGDSSENSASGDQPSATESTVRLLKGVMRVGVLAKGLLLHGDLNCQLVLLCAERPNIALLDKIYKMLPDQMIAAGMNLEDLRLQLDVTEAGFCVTTKEEPVTSCFVTLTSPVIRDPAAAANITVNKSQESQLLDKEKCLEALAALRHAKWFQAKASSLQSCVIVIRILRDLCQRVPTWSPLPEWAMELLVERCISSDGGNMSPGDALRRIFECLSSGLLLPGGPGIFDPCEKEGVDAAATITAQEREDITASAQHALRLIAFRQIHKVLDMEPLPAPGAQGVKRTASTDGGANDTNGSEVTDAKLAKTD